MDVGEYIMANSQINQFYIDSSGSLRNTAQDLITKDENDSLVINSVNAYIDNDSIVLNEYRSLTDSIIGRRMFDYYPLAVQIIVDFQAVIFSEFPEFEMALVASENVLYNAFLLTMGDERIAEWEAILHLGHDEDDTVEQRRDAVIARLRGIGKLNTESINRIVNAFTGGTAESYVENSTLYVWIIPPRESRAYKFKAIEDEISMRKPAHLGLHVERRFQTWGEVNTKCATWQEEATKYNTWNDTFYDISN